MVESSSSNICFYKKKTSNHCRQEEGADRNATKQKIQFLFILVEGHLLI